MDAITARLRDNTVQLSSYARADGALDSERQRAFRVAVRRLTEESTALTAAGRVSRVCTACG
jgi:hypothetical protein